MGNRVRTIAQRPVAPSGPSEGSTARSARGGAVAWWAALGLVFLSFECYVMTRWVTGPYVENVPSGRSVPPI
jgi:hypothetical protein